MINRIASSLVRCISTGHSEEEVIVSTYGLELLMSTVLNTIGLIGLGLIFHCPAETIIIIGLFYINQTIGGGFHASTHMKCFVTMAAGLAVALLIISHVKAIWVFEALAIISTVVMITFPVVLHHNKQHLQTRRQRARIYSRIVSFVQLIIFTGLLVFVENASRLISSFAIAMFVSAISRIAGVCLQKRHQ